MFKGLKVSLHLIKKKKVSLHMNKTKNIIHWSLLITHKQKYITLIMSLQKLCLSGLGQNNSIPWQCKLSQNVNKSLFDSLRAMLMYALKALFNNLFLKSFDTTFMENGKNYQNINFFYFNFSIKTFFKWIKNYCPKSIC